MKIDGIRQGGYTPSFGAVVNINASRSLLNAKDVNELIEIGKKIGDNNTKIDMFVTHSKSNPYVYKFAHKTEHTFSEKLKTEKISFETEDEVLKPTIKPVDFGKNVLKRVSAFITKNTTLV